MKRAQWIVAAGIAMYLALGVNAVWAHCDSMDGPVITEAKAALDKGDITPLLKWVKPESEPEVKAAFEHSLQVRKLGPEAKSLADHFFFETLIRVHRAGEGAPYTGLKPAGQQEEVVMAADKALEGGSAEELIQHVSKDVADGIQKRFRHAEELKKHANHNVEAGREFVEAYVGYMHYVEGIHNAAAAMGSHEERADGEAAPHHHE